MEDNDNPDLILMAEPLSPMLANALEAHRLLITYMRVGFTRAEAFDIVLNQIPDWTFPGQTTIEEERYEDDDDDLWEDIPDEMTEDDDSDD
jgi:hypothetical protein